MKKISYVITYKRENGKHLATREFDTDGKARKFERNYKAYAYESGKYYRVEKFTTTKKLFGKEKTEVEKIREWYEIEG